MNNVSILKLVVVILGLILVIMSVGVVVLVVLSKAVPSEFWSIILAGFTGLLGLLAPSKEVAAPPTEGGA